MAKVHRLGDNQHLGVAFRVGSEDAGLLAREFQPVFGVEDLLSLPHRHFYLKLMIDGTPSWPFSAETLSLLDLPKNAHVGPPGSID